MSTDYLHATEKASRHLIYAEDDEDSDVAEDNDDSALQEKLKRLLHENLSFSFTESPRLKKRQKVEDSAPTEQKDEQEFRLLSSHPPTAIVLDPKPITLTLDVREPQFEDTKEQAKERRRRARLVAVDYEHILAEAQDPPKEHPLLRRAPVTLRPVASSAFEDAGLALLRRPQRRRNTRPPVPEVLLNHLPYSDEIAPAEDAPKVRCPVVDAFSPPPERRRRTPRRRNKDKPSRPQPRFWSADGLSAGRYRRDTMKKAVYEP
ncbi:hypothetical protein BD626DRAFT_479873 [Schizophyllum amplum]|uniref:Uncharacterized protein n=1 Tax=Schizophyllum amplum TaxID=97359 RepID=A0A550CSN9_9AGAR|nr:hypothetical protein BD626DRAFT_479873 [Auriculariopsis ampla]